MNAPKYNASHLISNSFIVDSQNLNAESALSICKILNTIMNLNDEAIVAIFGTLDFNKIMLEHFYLDFIESAFVDDIVTFQSYINVHPDKLVEIAVSGSKRKGRRQVPIVNGSFVFVIRQGMEIQYSLS